MMAFRIFGCHRKMSNDSVRIRADGSSRWAIAAARWWQLGVGLLLMAAIGVTPVASASNTAGCDWTGSGLSTNRANREVISIYLRCTAGRIVWNYPRGAIRILLRKPAHLQDNFRACLKIYPAGGSDLTSKIMSTSSSMLAKSRARIYLEAPRRLIGLFGGDDGELDGVVGGDGAQRLHGGQMPNDGEVLVKCFRSINEQVALYVEADETPFASRQTIFKYNLEFINNKHYSMRPTSIADSDADAAASGIISTPSTLFMLNAQNHINAVGNANDDAVEATTDDNVVVVVDADAVADADANRLDIFGRQRQQLRLLHQHQRMMATPTPIDFVSQQPLEQSQKSTSIWSLSMRSLWQRLASVSTSMEPTASSRPTTTTIDGRSSKMRQPQRRAVDEQIVSSLGETFEICRPCTDVETAHAFCSSEIVTRGIIFGVQQRPRLATNEIYVNRTRLLRNNLIDILADQESMAVGFAAPTPRTGPILRPPEPKLAAQLSFHTPLHCATAHEPGEFVFMGRRRFEEMMVICAPRLAEWAATVERLQRNGDAPCLLSSS